MIQDPGVVQESGGHQTGVQSPGESIGAGWKCPRPFLWRPRPFTGLDSAPLTPMLKKSCSKRSETLSTPPKWTVAKLPTDVRFALKCFLGGAIAKKNFKTGQTATGWRRRSERMVSTPTKSTIAHLVDPLFFFLGPPEVPLGL